MHTLDVAFPLGVFTTVTGVSGSGKSSLVSQALVELVAGELGHQFCVHDDEAEELERSAIIPDRRTDRRGQGRDQAARHAALEPRNIHGAFRSRAAAVCLDKGRAGPPTRFLAASQASAPQHDMEDALELVGV